MIVTRLNRCERTWEMGLAPLILECRQRLLVGDRETTAALRAVSVAPDDAARYCVIGCNEIEVPGKLAWTCMALLDGCEQEEILQRAMEAAR